MARFACVRTQLRALACEPLNPVGAGMETMTVVGFAAVCFLSIATPGPDVLLAIHNGARHGLHKACFGLLGVAVSDCLLVAAVVFSVGSLLLDQAEFLPALQSFGILYIAILSLVLLRSAERGGTPHAARVAASDASSIFLRSLIVAVTNPKAWLFFAAVLPHPSYSPGVG